MSSKATAHDFEDLAAPLEEDKARSFVNDELVRKSYGSRSKSFITARDVGGGDSPRDKKKFTRSVSSLGESILGLSEAIDEDEYLLSSEYLQHTAYECLLIANSTSLLTPNDSTLRAIHGLRKRLNISEELHHTFSNIYYKTLERVQSKVPQESIVFRLYMIETLILLSVGRPSSFEATPKAELRHLAIFACATQFAIKKLGQNTDHVEQSFITKLHAQLSYDVRKMKSRLVLFSTSPTTEHGEAVRALIAGMVVRYTQYPFVTGAPESEEKKKEKEEPMVEVEKEASDEPAVEILPRTPDESSFTFNGPSTTDDLVMTESEQANSVLPIASCRSGSALSVLNVSGDQEEEEESKQGHNSKPASTPQGAGFPAPSNPTASLLGYTHPLNVMVYATLFHTFFVDNDELDNEVQNGVSKAQWRKGVHRSRRQETRMKDVVDVLSSFRRTFNVTGFLHASCFVHVVFTENSEGTLDVADMFSLLSIDCYYYPGFKSYCTVQNSSLDADEQLCRKQVLKNMKDDFTAKLADYHAELAEAPEDLLFIAKLYAIILQFNSNSYEDSSDGTENPDSITMVQENITDRESESCSEQEKKLNACLGDISKSFGEDLARQVREVMESGGVEEAVSMGYTLDTYCGLVCLVICSTMKHFIRVKYKVVTSRKDGLNASSKPYDVWMNQLSTTAVGTAPRRKGSVAIPNQSLSSLSAAVGTSARVGAARLAPTQSFCKTNSVFTLEQINTQLRLSMTQVRHLLEVLLLEIHADVKYYSSSLVCVLPSAVSVVLNMYCNLLAEDMSEALESLQIPSASPTLSLPLPLPLPLPSPYGPGRSINRPVTPHTSSPISDTDTRMVSAITLAEGNSDSTPSSSPKLKNYPEDMKSPPPPKRSTSPSIPVNCEGRASRCHNDVNRSSTNIVLLDDIVSLSMFVTSLVYTMLMLELLQANIHTYLVHFKESSKKTTSFEKPIPQKTKTWSQLLPKKKSDLPPFNPSSTMPTINTSVLHHAESTGSFATCKRGTSMPEPVITWDGNEETTGIIEKTNEVLNPLQAKLLKNWKHVVETALDIHVQKVVSVDTFDPVGTSQEAGISSSAVDLTLMTNRIAVLVVHGIENAWDALKASRVAIHTNPVAPGRLTDENICQHFSTHCENLIGKFEEECKAVLNRAFCKYGSLLTAAVHIGEWNTKRTDFRLVRAKQATLFKTANARELSLRANDIYFCQLRMKDIYTKTISSYHLVTWKLIENGDNAPRQSFKVLSPMSPPIRSPRSPLAPNGMFDALSASRAEENVSSLLKFIAVKIALFDLQPVTSKLYTTEEGGMSQLLDCLEHSLTTLIEYLVPPHRVQLLSFTLGELSALIADKLMRGKMVKHGSKFEFFQKLVEDLHGLREFFLNRDEEGVPMFLQEKEVQSLTASLLSTILLLLAKDPTGVIHEQGMLDASGLPVHVKYYKPQLQVMMLQMAGRCTLGHNMILEALEFQREAELQRAWEAQRTRMMGGHGNVPARLLSPSAKSGTTAKQLLRNDDKKVVSRTCLVQ